MGDDSPSELPTVLVLQRSPTIALLEPLCSQKFNFLKAWDSPLPQDQFLTTHAGSVQALIAPVHGPPITAQILQSLPSLKFITTTSAGLDHVDLAECQRRGVAVANASKAFAEDAADMAVGLFIDVMRKISASNRYVRDGLWPIRGDYPLGSKIPITQEAEMTGLHFCDAKDDVPSEQLPHLLLIHPPSSFTRFPPEFCAKFPVLKAWESPLPLDQFLSTHAGSIQALLVRGYLMVNADILEQLPALKLVLTISVGVNHIDMAECRRRGISVANVGSAYSEDVADIAVGLYIDVLRKLSAADRYVRQGFWSSKGNFPLGSKLGGKRVGIIGLGSIGSEVAKRLEAFGCIISYNSRREKPSLSYPFYRNVSELAANSDALIVCCALTDQTHHMINKEVLALLGREGVIVNVGRGAIIDEKELVKCLVSGEIRGAGFDVFENEPQVPEELFALDNVVLSPHKAVSTPESSQSMTEMMTANLEAFFSNKPLVSPVMEE